MESTIMFHVPNHYRWRACLRSRQEHSSAGYARDPILLDSFHEFLNRHDSPMQTLVHGRTPTLPSNHYEIDARREQQWHIPTLCDLREISAMRNEESTIMNAPASAADASRLQRQISRIARNKSADVISMVAETAIP